MKNLTKEAVHSGRRVRLIAMLGILAAASVVLGKLLAISVGSSLRISFESLPVIYAGIVFGPVAGAAVGAVADLVGCLVVGYTVNPIITLGAVCCGLFAGLTARFFAGERVSPMRSAVLPVLAAHVIGSVIIKSLGLRLAFHTPWSLLAVRMPIYICNIVAESAIIYILLKSEAIRAALRGFGRQGK